MYGACYIYHLYRPVSKLATLKCSQARAAVERRRTARRTAAARETESVYASANIRVTPRDWNSRWLAIAEACFPEDASNDVSKTI